MAGKPVLHYFDGRGRMEPIRWLLAAAGVEALKNRISDMPTIKKFLQPGSQRQPPVDEKSIQKTRKIFKF